MRHLVLSLCALSCLLASACATTGATRPESSSSPATGTANTATDFTLTSIDGSQVSLSDHLGKEVILLNFWATWCTPCAAELPHLQALYEKHKADGFLILGIAMDGPESIANVAPLARRKGLKYPVLLDEETRVVGLYNPRRSAPFNVLIDRTGRVVSAAEGYNSGDEGSIEGAILKLLGKAAEEGAPATPAAAPAAAAPCH